MMCTKSVFRKVIDYEEARAVLEEMRRNKRVSSGYAAFDELTGGLIPGGVTLIGSRPAMGKTALALGIVNRLSQALSGAILIFSPRVRSSEVVVRLLSIGTNLKADKLLDGSLPAEELVEKYAACFCSQKCNIKIETLSAPSLENIRRHSHRLPNLRLLVVDNMECICQPDELRKPGVKWDEAYEPKEKILRFLKDLAQELDVPVICTAQLHRCLERRKDKRPILADLKKIDIPEELPDQIVFLYRDRYYDPFGKEDAECIVAKNTRGGVGTVRLGWNREIGSFTDILQTERK